MRILITGATGLIGTELVSLLLRNGLSVHYLTTSRDKIKNRKNYTGFYWDPQKGIIDESALIGVDAIVHLAGASIAKRWTDAYREEILESRVFSGNLLFNTLKKNPHQVQQIITASAIGIYPDSLTEVFTEDSQKKDDGFLGYVVDKWESSIDKFHLLGIKVCKLRTGLVLSAKGGALPEMARPVKWGLGAPFGSGKQMQSWIHLDDLSALYYFAITNGLEGIYNAVAPSPVTNKALMKSIAKVLDKPLVMPGVPRFVMNLALGDMHELLFSSQNVSARKIEGEGFTFKYTSLDQALQNLLAK